MQTILGLTLLYSTSDQWWHFLSSVSAGVVVWLLTAGGVWPAL
jgi:hypothetical protein